MGPTPPVHRRTAPDRPARAIVAGKIFASFVIAGCLGIQTFEIIRPHSGKLWPFTNFSMYARAHTPGETARGRQLRAVSCDDPPRTWRIRAFEIGYLDERLSERLGWIAANRGSAAEYRAALSRVVASHLKVRPCALQVWELAVTTTKDGVEPAAFAPSRWTLRWTWAIDAQ